MILAKILPNVELSFTNRGFLYKQMKFAWFYLSVLLTKVMDSNAFLSRHKSMFFSLVTFNKENENFFLFA